jgi:hypothetical protein
MLSKILGGALLNARAEIFRPPDSLLAGNRWAEFEKYRPISDAAGDRIDGSRQFERGEEGR